MAQVCPVPYPGKMELGHVDTQLCRETDWALSIWCFMGPGLTGVLLINAGLLSKMLWTEVLGKNLES